MHAARRKHPSVTGSGLGSGIRAARSAAALHNTIAQLVGPQAMLKSRYYTQATCRNNSNVSCDIDRQALLGATPLRPLL